MYADKKSQVNQDILDFIAQHDLGTKLLQFEPNWELVPTADKFVIQARYIGPSGEVFSGTELMVITKPDMINVNGYEVRYGISDTTRFRYSEIYYVPAFDNPKLYKEMKIPPGPMYSSLADLEHYCTLGLAYKTAEDAIARAKAMLGIDPNE